MKNKQIKMSGMVGQNNLAIYEMALSLSYIRKKWQMCISVSKVGPLTLSKISGLRQAELLPAWEVR